MQNFKFYCNSKFDWCVKHVDWSPPEFLLTKPKNLYSFFMYNKSFQFIMLMSDHIGGFATSSYWQSIIAIEQVFSHCYVYQLLCYYVKICFRQNFQFLNCIVLQNLTAFVGRTNWHSTELPNWYRKVHKVCSLYYTWNKKFQCFCNASSHLIFCSQ